MFDNAGNAALAALIVWFAAVLVHGLYRAARNSANEG